MNGRTLRIRLPDGSPREIAHPGAGSLAAAIEAAGIELNTRCGGRGLCRGCLVEAEVSTGPRPTLRSCQVLAGDAGDHTYSIPAASIRDRSLRGVSVFEIRTSAPPRPSPDPGLGLALDLGTTTVAGSLWDLPTGYCLAHGSRPNAQVRYGDNVLSRITFSLESPDGDALLQDALIRESVSGLIADLQGKANRRGIVTTTVVGNPVMLHTFLGESLAGFARYPFKPAFIDQRESPFPGSVAPGPVHLLPGLGPFVGADVLAGAVASGFHEVAGSALFLDFGTNGEMLLKHPGGYLATATAAGPAFEGGRLSCGSPAYRGAISSLARENGTWRCRLIGGRAAGAARSISGAAYIDFLALALRDGLLNPVGRFLPGAPVEEAGDERRMRIEAGVFISEPDVAEILQAKAAIGGGIATLLEEAGLGVADLTKVFVAGGFGYHLDPANATAIGLLPAVEAEKVEVVGNAALGGASLSLLTRTENLFETLRATCRVVELNQVPSFADHFSDALLLEPLGG